MLENTALIASSNYWFATLTLIGLACVAIWIVDLLFATFWMPNWKKRVFAVVERFALPAGFFISLFAMLGSLYYSYYLHIPACELCWFARVFIYPQVFIFGLAWHKQDRRIFDYIMMLSGVGIAIGLYHQFLQMGYDLYKPCAAIPFAADCSVPTFIEYGFVTYPLMGVVTLAFTFLLAFTAKRYQK
ncbi:MAG: disulfide bond formation protein B [Candidatus Paceibacterota bacterium]